MTNKKIAWVAGASGLIGRSLVQQLCEDKQYNEVYAFVRSQTPSDYQHQKLSYFTCDWNQLFQNPSSFEAPSREVSDLFCALGSTKKKTPNAAEYVRIDVEYPEAFAKLGKQHGARFYGLVSANGADGKMPSTYLSMKRDVEHRIKHCDYAHAAIARPSLLLGDREEFRLGETASEFICKLLPGNLKAIDGADVAAALIRSASSKDVGVSILSSKSMQGAAQ